MDARSTSRWTAEHRWAGVALTGILAGVLSSGCAAPRAVAEEVVAAPAGRVAAAPAAVEPPGTAPTQSTAPAPVRAPASDLAPDVDALTTDLLAALGSSDSGAAWQLLDARARATWGGPEAFAESASGFAEGLAAFGDADRTWLDLDGPHEGARGVVLLSGTVTREGVTERAAYAFGVDDADGAPRAMLLSPATRGLVDLEVPAPGQALPSPAPLSALVARTAVPRVYLDGAVSGEPVSYSPVDQDRERLSTVLRTAPAEEGSGDHTALVVALRDDGLVSAQAAAFASGG